MTLLTLLLKNLRHLVVWLLPAAGASWSTAVAQDAVVASEVEQLVRQLNAPQAAARDEAERTLIALGAPGGERGGPQAVLSLLPESNDRMPPEVRHRLTRIRQAVEQAQAQAVVAATHVTLQADQMPLSDVLAAIEEQTGNRITDQRLQFGQQVPQTPITIEIADQPFWPALDEILDRAQLTVYTFSGEDALMVQPRPPGAADRSGAAHYAGPYRIAATQVFAARDLQSGGGNALRLTLEIVWEPRLTPVRISHPLETLRATDEQGGDLGAATAQGELDAPVHGATQATELQLTFPLPPRSSQKIARLTGTLNTVVPGRTETFRFEDLVNADRTIQRRGGAVVTLDRVRKAGELWEVHMRVGFDETAGALQSHMGWAFQNPSYLVDKDGTPIENVGYETTLQTEQEIGLAYLFELPEGQETLAGLAWEYKTPAAIIPLVVEYELKNIPLP